MSQSITSHGGYRYSMTQWPCLSASYIVWQIQPRCTGITSNVQSLQALHARSCHVPDISHPMSHDASSGGKDAAQCRAHVREVNFATVNSDHKMQSCRCFSDIRPELQEKQHTGSTVVCTHVTLITFGSPCVTSSQPPQACRHPSILI